MRGAQGVLGEQVEAAEAGQRPHCDAEPSPSHSILREQGRGMLSRFAGAPLLPLP